MQRVKKILGLYLRLLCITSRSQGYVRHYFVTRIGVGKSSKLLRLQQVTSALHTIVIFFGHHMFFFVRLWMGYTLVVLYEEVIDGARGEA